MTKRLNNIVFAIPIINIIVDLTTNYFSPGILSPGGLRALFLLGFQLYVITHYYTRERISVYILFYSIYILLIILLFSTDFISSLNLYLKYLISLLMFPIGYIFINQIEKLVHLTKVYYFTLVLIFVNILIANIFKLGGSTYLEDSFYFGSAKVNITKYIVQIILVFPILLHFSKTRIHRFYYYLFFIGVLVILIGLKRTAIGALFIGLFIYYILTPYKLKYSKFLIYGTLFLILLLPIYRNVLTDRFRAREEFIRIDEEEDLEKEGRYWEFLSVKNAFLNGSTRHILFGSEMFNDRAFFNTKRMLHMDYSIILNGSGLVGSILYFILFLTITLKVIKYDFYFRNKAMRLLNSTFWSVLIASLIISISGSIYSIGFRSFLFLLFGAIIRIKRQIVFEKFQN